MRTSGIHWGTFIFGAIWVILGSLAALGELYDRAIPTARWFFEAGELVGRLTPAPDYKVTLSGQTYPVFGWVKTVPWFGWLCVEILALGGLTMMIRALIGGPPNPVTRRRIQRFREIRRGYVSLIILLCLAGIAALDQIVVGNRALVVYYNGTLVCPAFRTKDFQNKDFGMLGEAEEAPADYRELKRRFAAAKGSKDFVIMPLIPYAPTGDTLPPRSRPMVQRNDLYFESGSRKPYSGLVAKYHDIDRSRMHLRYTMRDGRLLGPFDGWDADGNRVYSGEIQDGKPVNERYSGGGDLESFLAIESSDLRAIKYHPAPPIPEEGHWLGTTSSGYDVVAYLYGGLQVNFKAALIYIPIVYFIGITVGMLMGFFGGWFDLAVQRLIEVLDNMPFLFVVIIFSSVVPETIKGLPIILAILIAFGWMSMTYLMRTAAYRDKERDYIAAARVLGAGTPRILFRHLLPNTVAILVTLVPFTISGLIFSLTALDYLGFGLPPEYATWGRLLNDGLANLSAPWLVTSTFAVLVTTLVLITFVGEAIREAFDPKKFTYYR
jgi:microcin C transport system permease protein